MTPARFSGARAARGFTLLELLVVMALLGVATLLAIGLADPIARAARERSWANRLQAELMRTRNHARASGAIGVASFLPERSEIRFVSGTRSSVLSLPDGTRITTAGESGELAPSVIFFPDGTASALDLLLQGEAGHARRLTVHGITGKIELTLLEPPA